jgi:hypothetical protein
MLGLTERKLLGPGVRTGMQMVFDDIHQLLTTIRASPRIRFAVLRVISARRFTLPAILEFARIQAPNSERKLGNTRFGPSQNPSRNLTCFDMQHAWLALRRLFSNRRKDHCSDLLELLSLESST